MSVYPYLVGAWLLLVGALGIVRSRNLIHSVVCLSVAQAGTYVLLLSAGFESHAAPPVFGEPAQHVTTRVADPLVQAMTLTDIVVSATVTALLLAVAVQIDKRQKTLDPSELRALQG